MPHNPPLSEDEIKARADRAEGKKPESEGKRGGRPPKYQSTFAVQAAKLCALGATDEDLADFFEVSVRTVIRWKSEHEEFCQALKVAKEEADNRVERSLYQRAVGYSFDGEKVFNYQGEVVRAKTREHCPPDVTAQIFWLKNRRPVEWRDKVDHDLHHDVSDPLAEMLARIAVAGAALVKTDDDTSDG